MHYTNGMLIVFDVDDFKHVNDVFGHSGPAAALLKEFGLSAEHIAEVAVEFCK